MAHSDTDHPTLARYLAFPSASALAAPSARREPTAGATARLRPASTVR